MRIDPIYFVPIITPVLKLWYRSLRYKQVGYDIVSLHRNKSKKLLFALWHDELLPPIYIHKNKNILILVSESRDGELITRILKNFGYDTVRGSSTRGGVKALKQLLTIINHKPRDVAITIDGPTGPRHEVKEGIIYISWKLKIPIVPVRTKIYFKKVFSKSWDKFQLPLPGSMCKIIYGKPYIVPYKRINSIILKQEAERLKKKMEKLILK